MPKLTEQEIRDKQIINNSIERVINSTTTLLESMDIASEEREYLEQLLDTNLQDWKELKSIVVYLWNEERNRIFVKMNEEKNKSK